MKHNKWNSAFKLDVMSVIKDLSIKGLRVGSSITRLHEIMGEPELPVAKISKKSKIYYWLYGNISFLSEENYVVAIDIDFHSNREKVITFDNTMNWELNNWLNLAKEYNFNINNDNQLFYLTHDGISICLSQYGRLSMVSLR
ncbi:hypothetical protein [Escherichia sp. 11.1600]|uniref:hypothetical protein n=1 Tax=Escherichia sp. 11.1600 TaxID=2723297 RepID=UPI0015FECD22|nr:hypothetical protein [Escherichia sp. 11.1600]MBB2435712.1 hypothetical protein [Escherichia sp. 11.1600]